MLCFGFCISVFWLHTKMWYLRVLCSPLTPLEQPVWNQDFYSQFPLLSALNQRVCQEKKACFPGYFFIKTKLIWSSSHGLYPFYNITTNNTYYFWLAPFAESHILKRRQLVWQGTSVCNPSHQNFTRSAGVLQQVGARRPQLLSLDLENIYM